MSGNVQVAVILDTIRPSHRKIIKGIARYVQQSRRWSLYIEADPRQKLPDLRDWHGQGIIANLDDPRVAVAVGQLKIPVVGVGAGSDANGSGLRIPFFGSDHAAIARMAADHLLEMGFHRFAYCGFPSCSLNQWSDERARAFAHSIESVGFSCSTYQGHHHTSCRWEAVLRGLCEWLSKLETPVGVMACGDARARHVLEACHRIGARIPHDIGVIGVGNDELTCELTIPPLSSVESDTTRLGYLAAALLDEWMSGKTLKPERFVIPPSGVVMRQSTNPLVNLDAEMVAALDFIAENACKRIQARDVAESAMISRSTLESRFKSVLGRTIHAEIRCVQLAAAKELLADSSLSLKQVARSAGFNTIQYMTTVFRKHVGETPKQYRRHAKGDLAGQTEWTQPDRGYERHVTGNDGLLSSLDANIEK